VTQSSSPLGRSREREPASTGPSTACLPPGPKSSTTAAAGVHVSGHAASEELKVMLNLVRPQYFMPVHGEHRHLYFHAELARATGIPSERIFVLENGDILELSPDSAQVTGKVQAGMILVDASPWAIFAT